jgi:hypothetical protein
MTIPDLLRHRAPLREITLRGKAEYHIDDETGERYTRNVLARPVKGGWSGYYAREHMGHGLEVFWDEGVWELVK